MTMMFGLICLILLLAYAPAEGSSNHPGDPDFLVDHPAFSCPHLLALPVAKFFSA